MPHFRNNNSGHISSTNSIIKTIETIPKNKLILIDNSNLEIKGDYGSIYQDYKGDLIDALYEGIKKLKKYDKIILVYPSKLIYPYPRRTLHGFREFCIQNKFEFEVIDQIYDDMEFQSKDVYITIEEMDLVNLVRQIRSNNLKIGAYIGIISYNETPLKDLLDITVISTDFKAMGEAAARLILENKTEKIKNIFHYIERNSL